MPNAEKIRETLAVARANQHRLNMAQWARGQVNPNAASWQDCGVSFCLAGWRAVLDGLRPQAGWDGLATGYFLDEDDYVWRAADWAAKSMELDYSQSDALFVMTSDVTDIAVLDWAAEQVIAGNLLADCDDCDGSGSIDNTTDEGDIAACATCEGRGLLAEPRDVALAL